MELNKRLDHTTLTEKSMKIIFNAPFISTVGESIFALRASEYGHLLSSEDKLEQPYDGYEKHHTMDLKTPYDGSETAYAQ